MSAVLSAALVKFLSSMADVLIKLIVFIGVLLVLAPILPADPLQKYIIQFTSALAPYTGLLNYFVPVGYCFFAFSFFIAWKYIVKPIQAFFMGIQGDAFSSSKDLLGK